MDDSEKHNNEEQKQEDKGDKGSNSGSLSSSNTVRSRLDIANADSETKVPIEERGLRRQKRPRRRRNYRRVDKRRRMTRDSERAPTRNPRNKPYRDSSTSTIVSKLSSLSRSRSPLCKYCKHRICHRRSMSKTQRRTRMRNNRKKLKKRRKRNYNRRGLKRLGKESKGVQVGSRSMMLSPLFINEGLPAPTTSRDDQNNNYNQITPEMIYQTVRTLTMWRQDVKTQDIYKYIKRNYPVNQDEEELQEELKEKLRIASIVGLLVQVGEDLWCLNCALMNRELFDTHVSKFWDMYVDTLQPIPNRIPEPETNKNDHEDNIKNRSTSKQMVDNMYS